MPTIETLIASVDTPAQRDRAVRQACNLLKQGAVVVLPTETVYGLAANALDPNAVQRIFEIKRRPASNPLIVHVHGLEMARSCAAAWPRLADQLAAAFWPGPLTMVLPKHPRIPANVTAWGHTVAIRWPSHPIMQRVIEACGFPLAAPSANIASETSPTNAEHARHKMQGRVALVIDGGQCQVGIESTVVDLTEVTPRVLRPGMIGPTSLAAIAGSLAWGRDETPLPARSPGMLDRHYAPKAKLEILAWNDDEDLMQQLVWRKVHPGQVHVLSHTSIPVGKGLGRVAVIPRDPEAYARAIYAELHRSDQAGAVWIIVEALPDGEDWSAIRDRLRRASHPPAAVPNKRS